MTNKKSLLQDSLQELENIKNESLELAKEQLINESADLLEKKSAKLFEKLIAGEESDEEESMDESLDEILSELKKSDEEDESEEDESEEDMDDEEEGEEGEESDMEDMDSEEGDMEDMNSEEGEEEDDEEDIEFGDEDSDDEFQHVEIDETVLAENFKRNSTKNMKNSKKQVLRDLRDVSFNKLVEAYYNMDESDSFVVQEFDAGFDDDLNDNEDMPLRNGSRMNSDNAFEKHSDMDFDDLDSEDEEDLFEGDLTDEDINEMLSEMDMDMGIEKFELRKANRASGIASLNARKDFSDDRGMNSPAERVERTQRAKGLEGSHVHEFMDEEMYSELDEEMFDEDVPSSEQGSAYDTQEKHRHFKGDIHSYHDTELEEAFQEMSMEELEEMHNMLEDDGSDMDTSMQDGQGGEGHGSSMRMKVNPEEDYMSEEEEIEEMLAEMQSEEDDELEESMRLSRGQANKHQMPKRVRNLSEEEMSDVQSLKEKVAKLEKEKETLQEGFVNKVKSLENKVYDVTISALKAGFVNKFLLEHPLRENEKMEIIHRFSNAQTKEQIKETYISLTNEFAREQTVKDGSLLKESVQNRVGKIHRTDNAVVTEKDLINENDDSNRFKQLLNYNFGRKNKK